MIKWMTDIDLISTICQDYYHFFDNRCALHNSDYILCCAFQLETIQISCVTVYVTSPFNCSE